MDEQVIERNLTFVDTPGYGSGTSVSLPFLYPARFFGFNNAFLLLQQITLDIILTERCSS